MQSSNQQAFAVFHAYQAVFNALGNPIRQQIMLLLADAAKTGRPLSVGELAAHTALSRPTISHHIKILLLAKLVSASPQGTKTFYSPCFTTPLQMSREITVALEKMINKNERI